MFYHVITDCANLGNSSGTTWFPVHSDPISSLDELREHLSQCWFYDRRSGEMVFRCDSDPTLSTEKEQYIEDALTYFSNKENHDKLARLTLLSLNLDCCVICVVPSEKIELRLTHEDYLHMRS